MDQAEVTGSTQPRFVDTTFPVSANDGDVLLYRDSGLYVWWRGTWKFLGYLQVTLSSAGYVASSTSTDKLFFASDSIASLSSALALSRANHYGFGSFYAGYWVAGYVGTNLSNIVKTNFFYETTSVLGVSWPRAVCQGASIKGASAGYSMGGWIVGTAYVTNCDKLIYSSEGTASLTSGLPIATALPAEAESSVNGYAAGGWTTGNITTIRRLAFAADTVVNITSGLSSVRAAGSGGSSLASGYFMGGTTTGSYVNGVTTIDRLLFSSEARTALSSGLSAGKVVGTVPYSSTYGYFCGGVDTAGNSLSAVDKLNFSAETTASATSTLSLARAYFASTEI